MSDDELAIAAMVALADGNPGAIAAMCDMKDAHLMFLLALEEQDIKGSHIWICYSDLCKKDKKAFLTGILDGSLKQKLIETRDYKYYLETGKR